MLNTEGEDEHVHALQYHLFQTFSETITATYSPIVYFDPDSEQ